MAEKDYSPIPSACVRLLNDKLYEKRKMGAQEIEKMVRNCIAVKNTTQIRKLLKVLGEDFTLSLNPNSRKGGLIGLAGIAIALNRDSAFYVDDLVKPILAAMNDNDVRVRYYACEAMYNVVKVARGAVLIHFQNIFDALSRLSADSDTDVKNGAETLDRLMKDIVTESPSFDLPSFMNLLRQHIHTENTSARQFVVSWVSAMNSVPDIDMLVFLPEILDGLFKILADPSPEISNMCQTTLREFLCNISKNPQNAKFSEMVCILIEHSRSPVEGVQQTALHWIREFVRLSGHTLLSHASGILLAVLPNLSSSRRQSTILSNIRESAVSINANLLRLVTSTEATKVDGDHLDLTPVIKILVKHLDHDQTETRIAVLQWIYQLYIKIPDRIIQHVDVLFPKLIDTLSDPADEVVMLDLDVLSKISTSSPADQGDIPAIAAIPVSLEKSKTSSGNDYFEHFIESLLNKFSMDPSLLEDRGSFIIRQLCLLLNAEAVYRSMSELLEYRKDLQFQEHMVQTLNTILLTSTELFELRNRLKDLKTDACVSLFCCLYRTWCHHPPATVALCLLTQHYKHVCDLLTYFSDLEVTVAFLTEIDKLVQLIESPIFTYLRLQLLDTPHNAHLVKSLYGLLMLLPQSDAFHTLKMRLSCVPNVQLNDTSSLSSRAAFDRSESKINFAELLEHFKNVQEQHKALLPENRRQLLHLAAISSCVNET